MLDSASGLSFRPAVPGEPGAPATNTNGSFVGLGYDVFGGSPGVPTLDGQGLISVTNDFQSKNMIDMANTKSNIYSQPVGGSIAAYTNASNPYKNFSDSSVIDPETAVALQVWELGNSLAIINGLKAQPGMFKSAKDDPGTKLVDCYDKKAGGGLKEALGW